MRNSVVRYLKIVSLLVFSVSLFAFGSSEVRAQDLPQLARQISVEVTRTEDKMCKQFSENGESEIECREVYFQDPDTGKEVSFVSFPNSYYLDNKFEIESGDRIYVLKSSVGEQSNYTFTNFDRSSQYVLIAIAFALLAVLVGGKLGLRSMISLAFSASVLVFLVVPMLADGNNPVLVATFAGSLILIVTIYISHGINKMSTVAILGTIAGIVFSLLISLIFTQMTRLTGYSNEYSFMLKLYNEVDLDMRGILLASFILGGVGVVDDAAVSQVAVVAELIRTGKKFKGSELFRAALRVGQSHIGSLINTLFMAYVASALPLIIMFVIREENVLTVINLDMFAEEVVRTAVGSMGLIFSVPATTYIATKLLNKQDVEKSHVHDLHTHTHVH